MGGLRSMSLCLSKAPEAARSLATTEAKLDFAHQRKQDLEAEPLVFQEQNGGGVLAVAGWVVWGFITFYIFLDRLYGDYWGDIWLLFVDK